LAEARKTHRSCQFWASETKTSTAAPTAASVTAESNLHLRTEGVQLRYLYYYCYCSQKPTGPTTQYLYKFFGV